MIFKVLNSNWNQKAIPKTAFLIHNNWDDFGYATTFSLQFYDESSVLHKIGQVKIGGYYMSKPDHKSPKLDVEFTNIGSDFFSLGQDVSYYEKLIDLGNIGIQILIELNDLVVNINDFDKALSMQVTQDSLLRNVSELTVRRQFRRVLQGLDRLMSYSFVYRISNVHMTSSVDLAFNINPKSMPPNNIHVIIGRNGVGKTRILQGMARALITKMEKMEQFGSFENQSVNIFSNLVSIAFSAFDMFDPLPDQKGSDTIGIKYSYVGLKYFDSELSKQVLLKRPDMLNDEFVNSLILCLHASKYLRWRAALIILESDPVFKEAGIYELSSPSDKEEHQLREDFHSLFHRLSSGHKIVLLTITRLIETVEEGTLVLLDEPESHLHPPLLSAFIRALSNLLSDRNGVAIVATHSPVILQEVPSSCVWKIRRSGSTTVAERPELETFGENVGSLTREVFGLEVTKSGFHHLLQQAVDREGDYDSVMEYFQNEVGGEGRAIVRALTNIKPIK